MKSHLVIGLQGDRKALANDSGRVKKKYIVAFAVATYGLWRSLYIPDATVISVRIGQHFQEVVQTSSFPVMKNSNHPAEDEVGFGATWVKEPAVIIKFNDPRHGFTLPPTTFAAVGYMDNKVDTIATTPMLRKVAYNKAVKELADLQRQFQAGGWQLDNGSEWYDLSPAGRENLHDELRKLSNGYTETKELVVPQKYSMIFRIRCADNCDSRIGRDRYLIDIGLAHDFGFEFDKLERERELTP
jgi:hypothetical protein